MTHEFILVDTCGDGPLKTGRITLNRPKQLNALNDGLMSELGAALQAFDADAGIGCIVITGSEKAFAAGADIGAMAKLSYMDAYKGDFITRNWEAIRLVRKPVIAGGTQRLPRAIGKAKAMDLVLTGRMMDASEAERCGLVSRVVPAADLMTVALEAAQNICDYSGPSVMMAKECVNRAFEGTLSDGITFERRMFHALFATADQKEGMDAFVAKRKPSFTHR